MSSASRKLIQASGSGSAGPVDTSDPEFPNVVLLLDGDGTNGDDNNTFTDSSTNGFTVTETGSVVQGSFSPYGDNWSTYFGAAQNVVASDGAIAMGSGNWTLEFWVYFNAVNNGAVKYLFDWRTGSDYSNSFLAQESSNNWTYWNASASGISSGLTSSTFSVGTWHHVALSRNSSTLKFFVDGTNVGSPTDSTTYDSSTITIGNRYTGSYGLDGYISNVRVVKGTALYTSDFTPPTDPLTAITNTQLLTCQSNRFVDESTNNSAITLSGTPKVTPFSPFKNDDARNITTDGGSGYFEYGAANVLSVPSDTNLDLSTGDFTVEMWVYLNSKINGSKLYIDITSASSYWQFRYDSAYGWGLQYKAGIWIVNNGSASNVKTGEWQHVALTRSGSNFTIWQNGESYATGTSSANIGAYNAKNIGGWTGASAGSIDGYISDFRLTKGTALYTSSFTPPTSPISAGANTELFFKFQDAGIYDLSGINNLDTVGNVQIDTAVKKYGTGSLEFDGTGDYLLGSENPADVLALTGAFTAECWFYQTATAGTGTSLHALITHWNNSTNNKAFVMGINSTSMILYVSNNGTTNNISGASGGTVSNNVWNHAALTWDGTNYRVFLNGTAVITQANSSPPYASNEVIQIGTSKAGSGGALTMFYEGYMDDIRITKGIARYTSNFTPPDAALPKF